MAMIIKSSTPKGHDPALWMTAQAIKKSYKGKKGKPRDYSKAVKRYSKDLDLY